MVLAVGKFLKYSLPILVHPQAVCVVDETNCDGPCHQFIAVTPHAQCLPSCAPVLLTSITAVCECVRTVLVTDTSPRVIIEAGNGVSSSYLAEQQHTWTALLILTYLFQVSLLASRSSTSIDTKTAESEGTDDAAHIVVTDADLPDDQGSGVEGLRVIEVTGSAVEEEVVEEDDSAGFVIEEIVEEGSPEQAP